MSGFKILLVEDEPLVRDLMKTILEDAGHTVSDVADVDSGLRQMRHGRFDVVITDLLVGASHGITILHAAKDQTPPPRVVAVSGGSVLAARALGADAALKKPFTRQELLSAVGG